METVTNIKEISNIKSNRIIGKPERWLRTGVMFRGEYFILFAECKSY